MQIKGGKLEYGDKDEKTKKISRIILIAIVLVFIAIIAIIGTILYLQKSVLKTYIDGQAVSINEGIILIDNDTKKVYVDIKGIAPYLNYYAHDGEYKVDSKDTNKCWVECNNETASFFLNSNKISKVAPNTNNDYEDYLITEPVISKDEKLYSTIEGIQVGFNVVFSYDEQANTIQIYTLPYLVNSYATNLKKYGYEGASQSFKNQKSILYNLFIVRKENNLYGVIDASGEEVVSPRYKSIEFNETGKEFYVKNNSNKVGILNQDGDIKISLAYDDISMIDKQTGLYIVKSGNKFGVLDNSGNIVIHLEYDKIGIDTARFSGENINNKYLLYGNVIPVSQNNKWGLFNTSGKLIVPVEFDEIGCSQNSTNSNMKNIILIPSYKGIVMGKTKENNVKNYGIYNNEGKELVACALTKVYSITKGGIETYHMEYQGNDIDVEAYINAHFAE